MSESPRPFRRRKPADPGLTQAIQAAGSSQALAFGLNLTPARVSQWYRLPPKHALAVERKFGVSRSITAPDFYPPSDEGVGAAVAA